MYAECGKHLLKNLHELMRAGGCRKIGRHFQIRKPRRVRGVVSETPRFREAVMIEEWEGEGGGGGGGHGVKGFVDGDGTQQSW